MKRLLLLVLLLPAGCRRAPLSAEDCRRILDRIVDLELAERGFRDPALAERRKNELRALFSPDLAACVGRRVRPDALACVARATSAEDLSHHCLR